MIKVGITDDHQMFVDGICSLFSDSKTINISLIANSGKELLQKLKNNKVDVILMDSDMPQLNGLETTKLVKQRYPDVKIIVLTMHADKSHITRFINAGASGYLLKNTSKSELETAIPKVASGESYYSQEVSQVIMNNYVRKNREKIVLSEREIEVLKLISDELTTKEIAEQLFISENTVETHRKNLISKLRVKNVVGLVKYALKENLV